MWPGTEPADATLMRLHAFVQDGARVLDKALNEFDRMLLDLKQEKEAQKTKTRELENILDDSMLAWLGKVTANMNAVVSTVEVNCMVLSINLCHAKGGHSQYQAHSACC